MVIPFYERVLLNRDHFSRNGERNGFEAGADILKKHDNTIKIVIFPENAHTGNELLIYHFKLMKGCN